MFVPQAAQRRRTKFNLLVLSEGEHYFSDYSCVYYPPARSEEESHKRQVRGRLKICSKSIIFDPQDIEMPLLKFEYAQTEAIEPARNSLIAALENEDVFQIRSNVTVEMKEHNDIAPYVFKKEKSIHRFSIKYVTQTMFLSEVNRLFAISRLTPYEADEKIKQIVMEKESTIVFDRSWLETFDERPLKELVAVRVTPLVINTGRLMITDRIMYFQPFNNVDPNPVEKFPLGEITRVVQRRYALRHVGLEIFLEHGTSAYFAFKNRDERDLVYELLMNQPGMTRLQHENQFQTTFRWQCGLISNYEYLMYLNSLAHRSFNDLAQYPVFPWILQDYSSPELDLENPATFRDLSRPIGALNPDRLSSLQKRFREMPGPEDQKFLYGTHYSTPGYVLYYLVRVAPEYMLRLQNGRFDEPDRLFHSISEAWTNVLINSADLKELIPEFFSTKEFLRNSDGIQLGRRQDGTRLGHVVLPPWASDEEDFIKKHRDALESEFVSQHIHSWIDLIFGYKQRGQNAIRADNVFHPLTYEGAVDIDSITDPMQKMAILMQINEFGQTPHQIFTSPHPQRFSRDEREKMLKSADANSLAGGGKASPVLSSSGGISLTSSGSSISGTLSRRGSGPSPIIEQAPRSPLFGSISSTGPIVQLTPTRSSSRTLGSASNSASNSTIELPMFVEELPSSSPILELDIDGLTLTPHVHHEIDQVTLSQSFDDSIWASVENLTATESFRLHRDVVTSVCLSPNGQTLYSVSQDSTLKIYSLPDSKQLRSISISQLALSSCVLTSSGTSVIISSWDNNIYTYSIDYGRVNDILAAHDDAVQCLALSDCTLASGSWDSTLKIWALRPTGIDKLPMSTFVELETEVKAVEVDTESNLVLGGSSEGMMFLGDLRMKSAIRTWQPHDDEIVSVKLTPDGRIISCSKDGHLKVENRVGHELLSIQLPETLKSMTSNGQKLLVGGDGGSLRVWDLLRGEEVCQLPKKSRCGISCISIPESGDLIVTGGDDGSITKWTCP